MSLLQRIAATTVVATFTFVAGLLVGLLVAAVKFSDWRPIDSIASQSSPTTDCKFVVSRSTHENVNYNNITMCWRVTLANQGMNKSSIMGFGEGPGAFTAYKGQIAYVENLDGTPLSFPFILDGGESR